MISYNTARSESDKRTTYFLFMENLRRIGSLPTSRKIGNPNS